MDKPEFKIPAGAVMQIRPDFKTKCFRGCLLTVTEAKDWGVQGYIQGVGATFEDAGGQYYLRPTWDEIELTGGVAIWIIGEDDAKSK